MSTDKTTLSRQVSRQAELLASMNGADLSEALLDTAAALTKTAIEEGGDDIEEIYDMMYPLIKAVRDFIQKVPAVAAENERKEVLEGLKLNIDETERSIADIQEEINENEQHLDYLNDEYKKSAGKGQELEKKIEALKNQIYLYPDDIVSSLEQKEKELRDKLALIEITDYKIQKLSTNITDLDSQLSGRSEEVKNLTIEYHAKKLTIEELNSSGGELAHTQEEIEELNAQIDELEKKRDELQGKLEILRNLPVRYNELIEQFSDEAFEIMNAAVSSMFGIISDRKEELTVLKNNLDKIKEQLEECQKIHEQYLSWFNADKASVEGMTAKAKTAEEGASIRQAFTLERQRLLNEDIMLSYESLEKVRSMLERIDKVISESMKYTIADEANAKKRAEAL